jgi:citrate lyase beta subunit
MPTIRPRRSVLYMPGSNARALEKAREIAADALILDLEDAVAPEAKAAARDQVCAAVKAGGYGRRELVIRTNGVDTPWFGEDLAAAVAADPDAILIGEIRDTEKLSEDTEMSLVAAVADFKNGFATSDGSSVVPNAHVAAMDEADVEKESVKVRKPAPKKK